MNKNFKELLMKKEIRWIAFLAVIIFALLLLNVYLWKSGSAASCQTALGLQPIVNPPADQLRMNPVVPTKKPEPPAAVALSAASEPFLVNSLPFHKSDKQLWVFAIPGGLVLATGEAKDLNPWSYSMEYGDKATFLGEIHMISLTGNSGGIYAPIGITKDDAKIVLSASMFDPGAGGGSVDYAYATIPVKAAPDNSFVISEFTRIATRSAHFYDSFSKVVYVDEGGKTPHYSIPGPANDGAIMFRNLITGENRKLLEETDTSYEITGFNENNGVLSFNATKYAFSEKCPREDNAQFCAGKTVSARTIAVP